MLRTIFAVAIAVVALPAAAQNVTRAHGFSMYGQPKYGSDAHFAYVNPNAPKGGDVRFASVGTFDSFNAWVLKGNPIGIPGSIETLMVYSGDEAMTAYCLICETIEVPEDRSWTIFHLRPEARFHDGSPIAADDVVWTFDTLIAKGHPRYRNYYASVKYVEKISDRVVKFTFKEATNRELPMIVGELPVLSKTWWATRNFEGQLLEAPLGSGPYRLDGFEAGRFVMVRRAENYWGRNLPKRRGMHNFETMRYEFFRDATVALEAFKGGQYDIRLENQALAWATRYEGPGLERGLYMKTELPTRSVSGMQGFVFNMRREIFKDVRVREALGYAFDFEWSNRTLFHGQYKRTRSYFDNSELAATGLPSAAELAILEPLRADLPPRVFTESYEPPKTDGTGNLRDNLRIATRLLREAGWQVKDGKLVNAQGKPFTFEFLATGGQFERIVLPYFENLKRLGIEATVRAVDPAQYQRREEEFDFDMTLEGKGQSESPGNEQRDYWTSAAADMAGSRNLSGLKNNAIDQLVELLIAAPDREALVTRTRALDRALQWSFLVVPNWHLGTARVAHWDRFGRPDVLPRGGYDPSLWWVDPEKDRVLREKRAQTR